MRKQKRDQSKPNGGSARPARRRAQKARVKKLPQGGWAAPSALGEERFASRRDAPGAPQGGEARGTAFSEAISGQDADDRKDRPGAEEFLAPAPSEAEGPGATKEEPASASQETEQPEQPEEPEAFEASEQPDGAKEAEEAEEAREPQEARKEPERSAPSPEGIDESDSPRDSDSVSAPDSDSGSNPSQGAAALGASEESEALREAEERMRRRIAQANEERRRREEEGRRLDAEAQREGRAREDHVCAGEDEREAEARGCDGADDSAVSAAPVPAASVSAPAEAGLASGFVGEAGEARGGGLESEPEGEPEGEPKNNAKGADAEIEPERGGLGEGAFADSAHPLVFEFPLSEKVRHLLRIEYLFKRFRTLREDPGEHAHHFALATLFEIMDCASRAEFKLELLQELERQRARAQADLALAADAEARAALEGRIERLGESAARLHGVHQKFAQKLRENEWLMGLKQKMQVSGGVSPFDIPSFYLWQSMDFSKRLADFDKWFDTLDYTGDAIDCIMGSLRANRQIERCSTKKGMYQQSGLGSQVAMLQVIMARGEGIMPEISANRHIMNIHFVTPDFRRSRGATLQRDVDFELALCCFEPPRPAV